jgi:hypothetical protein
VTAVEWHVTQWDLISGDRVEGTVNRLPLTGDYYAVRWERTGPTSFTEVEVGAGYPTLEDAQDALELAVWHTTAKPGTRWQKIDTDSDPDPAALGWVQAYPTGMRGLIIGFLISVPLWVLLGVLVWGQNQ